MTKRIVFLTLVVLLFLWTWNEFLLALVLVSSGVCARCPWGWPFFRASIRPMCRYWLREA